MEIAEILRLFRLPPKGYPQAIVAEAMQRREEITPFLLDILDDVAMKPHELFGEGRCDHIFAAFLLAHFREPQAWEKLMKAFSIERNHQVWGDWGTEIFGTFLARCFAGNVSRLLQFMQDESIDPFIRVGGLTSLSILYFHNLLERNTLIDTFRTLFTEQVLKDQPEFGESLCFHLEEVRPVELKETILHFYDLGLINTREFPRREFLARLERPLEDVLAEFRNQPELRFEFDIHEELEPAFSRSKAWGENEFDAGEEEDEDELYYERPDQDDDFTPYRAPPATGRNDPCPCGSGKKFKKCCGQ